MNKILYIICAFALVGNAFGQETFCLNLANPQVNPSTNTWTVEIQIAGDVPYDLGSSNFVFDFNTDGLANPSLVPTGPLETDFYNTGVTNPDPGEISYNVEYLISGNTLFALDVSTTLQTIATIQFDIIDNSQLSDTDWLYTGGTTKTVIFKHGNEAGDQIFATDIGCLMNLSALLPIKLSSFEATKHTANSTLLEWESTSEVNASHFVVQRSTDKQVWENIGNVKTKGDQFTAASYEMIDNNISTTRTNDIVYFYRLQMVDLDGYTEYSEVEAVRFDGIEHSGLFVFPNPTADEVYVTIDNVATLGGVMTVVDRNGATIKTQKLVNGQDERISLSDLPSGLYHMSVVQNDNVYSQKVIKID